MPRTGNPNPSVAILLATYNGAGNVRKQLESIQAQTYPYFCCYIHDDGSKDETMEIVRAFCMDHPDKFRIIEGAPCGGAMKNFLYLMKCVKSEEYIMFSDQDDVWKPEKLEKSVQKLEECPALVKCAYSDLEVVDEQLDLIAASYFAYTGKNPYKNDLQSMLRSNIALGCTMIFNRPLLELSLRLKNYDLITMHDWWVALLAVAFGKLLYIDEPLICYRQHHHNTVGAIAEKGALERAVSWLHIRRKYVENRKRMKRSINLAIALDSVMDSQNANKAFIHAYAGIGQKNKVARISFCLQHGIIKKNELWRIIWA